MSWRSPFVNRSLTLLPALAAAFAIGVMGRCMGAEGADRNTNAERTSLEAITKPELRVLVDPRIELVSLIFRLAGNREYNQAKVESYTKEVEERFGSFREHAVVKLARDLRNRQGVSYDACMSLAIVLSGHAEPALKVSLEPRPDFLDQRWTAQSASNFVAKAGEFVKETRFEEFIEAHKQLYATTVTRMQKLMRDQAHLEWFNQFFGEQDQAKFTLALGMLNGGGCYGPHWRDASGTEEFFCILGVWATDSRGLPVFRDDVLPTVVHEFCHSYANPIIDRHIRELKAAGERLFGPLADQMRSQAYGNAQTLLRESLVRASVVRHLQHYDGTKAAEAEIAEQKSRGFLWMQELSDLLGHYEAERDKYPTLESFSPRLVAFFVDYAKRFARDQAALDAKRPKVISLVPVNGATDVDPGLEAIQVVFDRPMRDGSWSMCGGGPHYPETIGKPHYDAQRTTWSVAVKLKPDWEYEFSLNAARFQSFQSEEGVPLKPVAVRFKTGAKATDRQ